MGAPFVFSELSFRGPRERVKRSGAPKWVHEREYYPIMQCLEPEPEHLLLPGLRDLKQTLLKATTAKFGHRLICFFLITPRCFILFIYFCLLKF